MALNSKHDVKVDQLNTVIQSFATKSDNRFAQGADIIFATDASNNLSATKNGDPVNFPGGGGGSDIPLSVDNQGRLCVTYTTTKIYGAEWDGMSTTSWTRTDSSALFTDPVPAVAGGTGSSPFDSCSPWKDIRRVTDSTAGELVEIPKFYYKWTRDGSSMKLQIADSPVTGFYCSPAHADRNDGNGERDVVYVGRYACASDYTSKTGVVPLDDQTRATYRSGIHNLGSTIYQWDYAMLWTIQMLYLVEFGNWDSQATIGAGCSHIAQVQSTGSTDSMQYHTGTMGADRSTYHSGLQYRWIEGLWSTVLNYVDGIYFNGADIYGIKNPADFSDTTNGILIGTRPTSEGYIKAYNTPTATGFEYALYPSDVSGSSSTYVCDKCGYDADGVVLYVGGGVDTGGNRGLFRLCNETVDGARYDCGSRLMLLPNAA